MCQITTKVVNFDSKHLRNSALLVQLIVGSDGGLDKQNRPKIYYNIIIYTVSFKIIDESNNYTYTAFFCTK